MSHRHIYTETQTNRREIEIYDCLKINATLVFLPKTNVGWLLVETNTETFEFPLDDFFVL